MGSSSLTKALTIVSRCREDLSKLHNYNLFCIDDTKVITIVYTVVVSIVGSLYKDDYNLTVRY